MLRRRSEMEGAETRIVPSSGEGVAGRMETTIIPSNGGGRGGDEGRYVPSHGDGVAGWKRSLFHPGSGDAGAETTIVPSSREGVARWERSLFHSGDVRAGSRGGNEHCSVQQNRSCRLETIIAPSRVERRWRKRLLFRPARKGLLVGNDHCSNR